MGVVTRATAEEGGLGLEGRMRAKSGGEKGGDSL